MVSMAKRTIALKPFSCTEEMWQTDWNGQSNQTTRSRRQSEAQSTPSRLQSIEEDYLWNQRSCTKRKAAPHSKPKHIEFPEPEPKKMDRIRICGVAESTAKTPREKNEHNISEIQKMLTFMEINEIQKMLTFMESKEDKKRTILLQVPNNYHGRVILLLVAKLKNYDKEYYID